jgi:hypothetical protein
MPEVHIAPFGASVQAPEPSQVAAPEHSLLGSSPVMIGPQLPSARPLFTERHDSHAPPQLAEQQTPSCVGQLPLAHCVPLVHDAPFGLSEHAPEPLHTDAPVHSLSGSWFAATSAQVPSVPPVFAARHDWQVPPQLDAQQIPSSDGQLPEAHCVPFEQGCPLPSWQVVQAHDEAQSTEGKFVVPLHSALHALPPQATCAPVHTAPVPHRRSQVPVPHWMVAFVHPPVQSTSHA